MDRSAVGWGNDCIEFKLSHKPGVIIIAKYILLLLTADGSIVSELIFDTLTAIL